MAKEEDVRAVLKAAQKKAKQKKEVLEMTKAKIVGHKDKDTAVVQVGTRKVGAKETPLTVEVKDNERIGDAVQNKYGRRARKKYISTLQHDVRS